MKQSEISQSLTLSQYGEQPGQVFAATDSSFKASTSTAKASKERFTKQDIENILTWLERPPNFKSVFGSEAQTVLGMPRQASSQGWATLAQVVSKQNKGRLSLNTKSMRERFHRHLKLFTETKKLENQTGFGVTDEDHKKGIYTTKQKLEKMCICYARMDALFGHRLNITPLFKLTTGLQNGSGSGREAIEKVSRHRLIVEEEEGKEEEEAVGFNKPIGNQEATEDGQFLGDTTLVHTTFDDSLYDNSSTGIDSDLGTKGEGIDLNDDNNKDSDIDDISDLSISSTSSPVLHSKRKRKLPGIESLQSPISRKWSQGIEERRKGPSLNPSGSSKMPRKSFHSAFELLNNRKLSAKENLELKRLELEEMKIREQMTLEKQKLERQIQKLELEKQRMEKEDEREKQKMEKQDQLEKQRMEKEIKLQTMQLMQAGIEKGMSIVQIQSLINLLH
ncbi:hypothetical protein BX616_006923 [Lobosporangium transversale]|nr:hypothetical protein BX616_006923 [Lobosporangium transversale]